MVLSKKRARKVIEEIIALFPDAKPSLNFTNHFELLVAVMLSAQTTDAAVNTVTPALFKAYPTPREMAVASENEIASYIARLGLYRNKAKFLKKCAQQEKIPREKILFYSQNDKADKKGRRFRVIG